MLEQNFLSFVAQDRGNEARAIIQDDLSNRVLGYLEERKRELARGLFSGSTEQVTSRLRGISTAASILAGRSDRD